jgi:transcriptional regulator with XRE-family HTH domain
MAGRTYPNLSAYLDGTGQNQVQLAKRLNRSQAFVSKVLNGLAQPSLSEALRISRICRIPVESLVTRSEALTEGK